MPLGERRITSSKDVQSPDLPGTGKVIIAMKGLPYTVKSGVALCIGQWMQCPVLSIDDFLDSVSLEKGSPTSKEEAERFRLLALYAIYKMAHRYLALYNCVVIKSRLYSLLELDLLMCLAEANRCANLIIVECRIMNEYCFRGMLEYMVERGMNTEFGSKVKTFSRSRGRIMKGLEEHSLSHVVGHLEWYKAKSWKDVENAKDDWIDDQAWDDHLLCSINDNVSCPRCISRLVVDPYDDLDFLKDTYLLTLRPDFLHVIRHLFDRWYEDEEARWKINRNLDESKRPNRYLVTKFNELRKSLVMEELRSSIHKQRSNKLCTTNGDPCVFKMPLGERRITSSKDVQNPYLLPEEGKVIIAMKGLPYTAKSEVALRIGQWARCPVLSIDDFLDSVSLEKGSPTSKEEAERFRLLASYALYKMAHRHLDSYNCIVIKSRLYSLLELNLLMCLVEANDCANLIIVECRIMNEYRFRWRLEDMVEKGMNKEFGSKVKTFSRNRGMIMKGLEEHSLSHVVGHLEWYKAKSWKDVENAKDDWIDDQAWDDHLLCSINDNVSCPRFVSRLVVDPFDDLDLHVGTRLSTLQPDFLHVISHLLDRWFKDREAYSTEEDEEEDEHSKKNQNLDESKRPNRYLVTKFNELRKSLVKEELRSSIYKQRSNKLCTTNGDPCVFKYHKKLHFKDSSHCMMCQERVELGTQAYTCHYCILTLHESCAKTLDLNFLEHIHDHPDGFFFFNYSELLSNLKENVACKSCDEEGRAFSRDCASCLFTTHVKQRLLPTIINHEGHEHFLSIQFKPDSLIGPEYGCHVCKFHHHMDLFFMPREVNHVHGGYEHVMKLTYAHRHDDDVMEPEDDYWCDVCYGNMDPQPWFYYCQDCSYYITHLYCPGKKSIQEAIRHRKLAIRECEFRWNFDKDMIIPADDDHMS
ncbi:hypothetical protein V2J09_005343 [Rumex salicifolius]